ncbi:MAG: hypothetical protein EBS84_21395 [Proteobacteria bacterium]|nr:hypothetical protein [Pseudomonadota bacterium]
MAVRREAIQGFYRDLLGREGSDGEVSGWENAPDENSVRAMFMSSPEYTSQHGGTAGWQDVGGVITPTAPPNAPPPTDGGGYQIQGSSSYTPTYGTPSASYVQTGNAEADKAGAKAALANVYKQFLGRDATDAELENWITGKYGWGSGVGDYDKFVSAIMGSDEARRYRPADATPNNAYKDINYWQSQGVPAGDIFDATTGQLRPGWRRTANGYERDTVGTPYSNFTTRGNDYSAFNTGRQQDPKKSAKDAFVMLSNQAPPPPFGSRSGLAAWFKQYIQPGMDALGHKVLSVGEDSFTYTNGEGTFTVDYAQNAGATPGSMLQRLQWGATPADDATRARYAGSGTTSTTGATRTGAGTSGAGSTVGDVRALYQSLGQQYGGPGNAGINNGDLQQVGQDPLSQLITGALANFLGSEGSTSFGGTVQDALAGLLNRGGALDDGQVARRYESARELLDKGRRTMINDMRGDLASRNLLSEPGIPQGSEIGGIERITEKLAPEFSRALRDIYSDESAKSDARLMTSLQLATGFSTDQARNLLAGIGEGTARQTALSDLALRSLQTNMAWSQFLAEFGLKRDQVMYDMQSGQIDQYLPLLQAFLQLGGMSNSGYV